MIPSSKEKETQDIDNFIQRKGNICYNFQQTLVLVMHLQQSFTNMYFGFTCLNTLAAKGEAYKPISIKFLPFLLLTCNVKSSISQPQVVEQFVQISVKLFKINCAVSCWSCHHSHDQGDENTGLCKITKN